MKNLDTTHEPMIGMAIIPAKPGRSDGHTYRYFRNGLVTMQTRTGESVCGNLPDGMADRFLDSFQREGFDVIRSRDTWMNPTRLSRVGQIDRIRLHAGATNA